MKLHYTITEIPPSNNEFIGRNVRWAYQNEKRRWAQLIRFACLPKPHIPLPKAVVKLVYHFKDNHRRDPDNYSGKMILDGLVRAGILKDDSFNCIKLQLEAAYDKGGYTEIFIEEENT